MLRRAGLSLIVGAILVAPSVASAAPALVFEPYAGTVLYAEDPDAQWFPASLTKLMTAYVTFQALKAGTVTPDTKVTCSRTATLQAPSKLGLPVGGSITLDVALKVLIVKSANDVAVMIAEAVAGSQDAFIARMNEAAQAVYEFIWNDFCDWYIEAAKLSLAAGEAEKDRIVTLLLSLLEESLRLAHPFLPLITEEIYQTLPQHGNDLQVQFAVG